MFAVIPNATASRWDAIQPWSAEGMISLINMVFMGTLGIFGNLLITVSIVVDKGLRKRQNLLVLNLALSDLNISLLFPFNLLGMVSGPSFYKSRTGLCSMLSMTCHVACICSATMLMFISVERLLLICKSSWHEKVFGRLQTLLYMAFGWICGLAVDSPASLGFVTRRFDQKMAVCIWDRIHGQHYTLAFSSAVALFLAITIANYTFIFGYVRRRKQNLKISMRRSVKLGTLSNSTQLSRRESVRQSITEAFKAGKALFNDGKAMFMSAMVFLICFAPFCLIFLLDTEDQLPAGLYSLTLQLMHNGSAASFFIYGLYNNRYREAFRRTLKKTFSCRH